MREIAEGAGVTAMLVNRYFGSKEQLFADAIADSMARPVISTPEALRAPDRAKRIAEALVRTTVADATALDGFLIMLRSASSARAAEIARDEIGKHHVATVSRAITGYDVAERTALLLALVAGVQIVRQVIALPALADADPDRLVSLLTPLVQELMG